MTSIRCGRATSVLVTLFVILVSIPVAAQADEEDDPCFYGGWSRADAATFLLLDYPKPEIIKRSVTVRHKGARSTVRASVDVLLRSAWVVEATGTADACVRGVTNPVTVTRRYADNSYNEYAEQSVRLAVRSTAPAVRSARKRAVRQAVAKAVARADAMLRMDAANAAKSWVAADAAAMSAGRTPLKYGDPLPPGY